MTLLQNADAFPMLRSLRVEFPEHAEMPEFWTRLATGFSNLISLSVSDCGLPVQLVTFNKLEILLLRTTRVGGGLHRSLQFQLPSLKHLALEMLDVNIRLFLTRYGHQLESLSWSFGPGPGPGWHCLPTDLWDLVPNITTLGVSIDAVDPTALPTHGVNNPLRGSIPELPHGHPLRQLVLFNLKIEEIVEDYFSPLSFWYSRTDRFTKVLAKFPTIQSCLVTQSILTPWLIKELRRLSKGSGIDFRVHSVLVRGTYHQEMVKNADGRQALTIAFFSAYYLYTCLYYPVVASIHVFRFGRQVINWGMQGWISLHRCSTRSVSFE